MHRFALARACLITGILAPSFPVWSQTLPQSIQVERLKVNRSQFSDHDNGPNLKQRAIDGNQDVVLDGVVTDAGGYCKECEAMRPEDNPIIRGATQSSDLVILGTVLSKLSAFTANDAGILTDSEVRVDEILKGQVNPSTLNDGGSLNEITLTYPGGAVRTHGHAVVVEDGMYRKLTIGHQYVFFLRYLSASHSYKQVMGTPGFDLSAPNIVSNNRMAVPQNSSLAQDKSSWIAALRSAIEEQKESERK